MKRTVVAAAILSLAGAALSVSPVRAAAPDDAQADPDQPLYLFSDLEGANEVGGGDAKGYGDLSVELKFKESQFCWELSVGDLSDVTAAHVHAGKEGVNGAPVITIGVTGEGNQQCVAADAGLLKQIAAAPSDYYVNVHTKDHGSGAIRGQLQE